MATKKPEDVDRIDPPRNWQGHVASQETEIRELGDDEKPDPSTIAQAEEIQPWPPVA